MMVNILVDNIGTTVEFQLPNILGNIIVVQ